MKKLAVALSLAASVAASPVTAAPSFDLGGYTGPIVIQFLNWENVTPTLEVNAENYGILRITGIRDTSGNDLWTQGGSNGFLAGVFADITVDNVTASPDGTLNAQGTGGQLDIYLSSTAPDPTQGIAGYAAAGGGCLPGDLCYNTISNNPDGILFLSLAFASGIDPTDSDITVNANFDTTTFPTSGDASAYLDVIGGAYASNFDTNSRPTAFGPRDFFLQNTFCPNADLLNCDGPVGDWQLLSTDPARGAFIPEPGTSALLGLGLLGIGLALRRRRSV